MLVQPIPVFNPAATAAGYAAAMQSARTAAEVARQTQALQAEIRQLQESMRRAQQEAIARENRLRQIDLWTRELEHRGMSPMAAHDEANREWQRMELLEQARPFADMVEANPPLPPSSAEYEEFRSTVEAELRATAKRKSRARMLIALSMLLLGACSVIGAYAFTSAWAAASEGVFPVEGLAVGIGGGLIVSAVGGLLLWWIGLRRARRRLKAQAALALGLSEIPGQESWAASVHCARAEGFLQATEPSALWLEREFSALGPSPLLEVEIMAVRSRYETLIAEAQERVSRQVLDRPDVDPIVLNNAAFRLLKSGHVEQAMRGLTRAAATGQPNALATLIWQLCLQGQFTAAVDAYQQYSGGVEAYLAEFEDTEWLQDMKRQVPNFTSNAAVAYLALGERQRALDLWAQAGVAGHAEARAYPAVLAWCEGDPEQARRILAGLTSMELADFQSDLEEVSDEGAGWFADFARDGLKALNADSRAGIGD